MWKLNGTSFTYFTPCQNTQVSVSRNWTRGTISLCNWILRVQKVCGEIDKERGRSQWGREIETCRQAQTEREREREGERERERERRREGERERRRETEGEREGKGERIIRRDARSKSHMKRYPGTDNPTHSPLDRRLALNPLRHTARAGTTLSDLPLSRRTPRF